MEEIVQEIYDSILGGRQMVSAAKALEALDKGINPADILNDGMIAAMTEVGRRFEEGEYYLPEMLISARAMQSGLAVIKPHLVAAEVKSAGKVVIGTVKSDVHEIGKNLVCMMLEGAGFEVIDLGIDVSPEKFVEAVRSNDADIVAMSALLTTTMPNMQVTIDALKVAGLRDKVKVMIGGALLNHQYAREFGADGYSPDANQAVALAKSLVGII